LDTVKSHLVEEGEAGDEVVHGGLGVHAANQLLGVVAVKQVGEAGDEVVHGGLGVHAANQLLGVVAVKQVN